MISRLLICSLIASVVTIPAIAQTEIETTAALRVEIAVIEDQVAEADQVIARYSGGLIRALAEMRREALLMSKAVLDNRILAASGGVTIEITVPATLPDEAKAKQILGEIAGAQRRVEKAEVEAASAGGLIQALALSRVETERLTLAQLQMAYFQAKYGIAFPTIPKVEPSPSASSTDTPDPSASAEPAGDGQDGEIELEWADSRFPMVDYSLVPFLLAYREGDKISGWWVVNVDRAAIDDSPKVTAINYSAYESSNVGDLTVLVARCIEGKTSFVYYPGEFLISAISRYTFDIDYRIDDKSPIHTRWSELTTNQGAGLFGNEAEVFLREIYDANKLFMRLREGNGQTHDTLFDLSGGSDAYEEVAAACSWTTLTLSRSDYQAIQTLLNAGGFDAGSPDGQWGPASQRAMKVFQASIGLPETGAPDRATLASLGFRD